MLLRLRLANHRSIRDQVELSLVSTRMRAQHPPEGDWANATNRVAGIYGANASGKSTVLHGFRFLINAVRYSATRWGERQSFPYAPFAFDTGSRRQSSLYEIDFTVDGVRMRPAGLTCTRSPSSPYVTGTTWNGATSRAGTVGFQ